MKEIFEKPVRLEMSRRCIRCGNSLTAEECRCREYRQDDGRRLSLAERLAFVHRDALALQEADPVALKHALKALLADAGELLTEIDGRINRERRVERAVLISR